jgi:hypothetical protein
MIQKQSNNRRCGRAHNHQEPKRRGVGGPEFNKEHVIVFFDVKGIVHSEFVPPKMMVNSDFYCDVLRRLRENVRQKRPALWHNHNEPARTHVPENHRVFD